MSTPGDIAAAEHQQPQSLTRTFTELRADGLIAREPSPHDRRALAHLTEAEVRLLSFAAEMMARVADTDEPPDQARPNLGAA
jgi:DNA-binding MarR family transcriptional regulator